MGEPIKLLQETSQDQLVLPETLVRTLANYRKAHHGYKFDPKEEAYIEYNTLRSQVPDTEEVTIKKIQRLQDRDTKEEWTVIFQESRVKDLNNNYVKCPIVEKIGVVPRPIANITNDSKTRLKNVDIVETENDYYIPFSKEKIIELFEKSKEKHKIVCYVGYTRPTRVNPSDTIEGKRIIWNQQKFADAPFSELVDKDEEVIKVLEDRKQLTLPNKVREIKTSSRKGSTQRVETLADLLPNLKKNKNKKEEQSVAEYQEDNIIDTVEKLEDAQVQDQLDTTNSIENDTQREYEELNS